MKMKPRQKEHKNEELGLTWVAKWLACVQQLKWYTFNETYHLDVLKRAGTVNS